MAGVALLNDFTHFHGCVSRPKELMTITYPAIRYILQTFINKGLALKDAEDFAAAACGLAAGRSWKEVRPALVLRSPRIVAAVERYCQQGDN